jgi:hypothetical protein
MIQISQTQSKVNSAPIAALILIILCEDTMPFVHHAFYSSESTKELRDLLPLPSDSEPVLYQRENGELVAVTGVYPSKEQGEQNYTWKDKVYLGEVEQYAGSLKPYHNYGFFDPTHDTLYTYENDNKETVQCTVVTQQPTFFPNVIDLEGYRLIKTEPRKPDTKYFVAAVLLESPVTRTTDRWRNKETKKFALVRPTGGKPYLAIGQENGEQLFHSTKHHANLYQFYPTLSAFILKRTEFGTPTTPRVVKPTKEQYDILMEIIQDASEPKE